MMIRGNNVLGIIFSNAFDETIGELTNGRTMGSVPFGGRYRLIDFTLSSMVNSGITKVGVIAKSNYQSLMDHLGSGKAWDLSKKTDGLYILPPFGRGNAMNRSRIDALTGIMGFMENSREEYVVISDSNIVSALDLQQVVARHIREQADITMVYRHMEAPDKMPDALCLTLDEEERVTEILISPHVEQACNMGINVYVFTKDFLIRALKAAHSRNEESFEKDILQRSVQEHKVIAVASQGYTRVLTSMNEYYKANMELLEEEVWKELFFSQRPVYTKVRDAVPAKYGLGASVSNTLVADGCVIDGTVENSILFRDVVVEKGAVIKNCIIMQGTRVGAGSQLQYVVIDKDVNIQEDRTLMGFSSYPVFIQKASVV